MALKLKFSRATRGDTCASPGGRLISCVMNAFKTLAYAGLLCAIGVPVAAQQDTAAEADQTVAEAAVDTAADASGIDVAEDIVGDATAVETAPDPELETILAATETSLEDWRWLKRPVVVFADSAADPRYVEQIGLITERLAALDERDVVVITDTDPDARSSVRRKLRARGFMLVIIAKDGTIVSRKPAPWDVREISRSIDKLPLRQQEIRDRRNGLRD